MKLLWVKADFLHPTTKGGQIRTLETLKRLHQRHEVHYVALDHAGQPEGLSRSVEYCTRAYPIPHFVPEKTSVAFAGQLVEGLFSKLPVAVSRYRSADMRRKIEELTRREKFDSIVCDFLFPAQNIPDLGRCVLFQHNVEATIWKRHVEHASNLPKRFYFELQAKRMFAYEGEVCRRVKNVIAVSENDADAMRAGYGVQRVDAVPTGVDLEFFARPSKPEPAADLVFLGSMDWMPNIDGMEWFVAEVLPLIRKRRPESTLAIVGRKPVAAIEELARRDSRIRVTGTVPDVRPYLWGSAASIVPLRIGGGTRLKIYEAMAARIPVVSTAVGAEGLDVQEGETIFIADQPESFAERCLALLEEPPLRCRVASAAWDMIAERYSWEVVSQKFEELLVSR
jgi:glycosyltransferase involved in cell wall biosynthesis